MEIRNLQPTGPERSRADRGADAIDLTRSNRERIAESTHVFEERQLEALRRPASERPGSPEEARRQAESAEDRVELSTAARALAEESDSEEVIRRRERIDALRAELEAGVIDTPERLERAASRLLGGG
ncbi:MAG: flagellar biosynthesis anti-sigma factor FlgM [Planctomycetes bacterium]|nr:flagellar biosynthesis anti-sigma factor FlgM [Planctomycetota bacterium]